MKNLENKTTIEDTDPDVIRAKLVTSITGRIAELETELADLRKRAERLNNAEAFPEISFKHHRYEWKCRICGKVAGKSVFLRNIPFFPESVCENCIGESGINLNEMGESS